MVVGHGVHRPKGMPWRRHEMDIFGKRARWVAHLQLLAPLHPWAQAWGLDLPSFLQALERAEESHPLAAQVQHLLIMWITIAAL